MDVGVGVGVGVDVDVYVWRVYVYVSRQCTHLPLADVHILHVRRQG